MKETSQAMRMGFNLFNKYGRINIRLGKLKVYEKTFIGKIRLILHDTFGIGRNKR